MTRAELQSVVLHGHEIAFRIAGDGPVILLVHGMAGSGATWDPVFDLLARDHTVIAPDLPGHGESDKPVGSDYSLGALASSLRDLLLSTGHRGATVVGHSLGGGIAMQFAYQFPSRCERLVLVGAGGLGPDVSPMLRVLTFPGVEYLFPVLFASQLRDAGTFTTINVVANGLMPPGLAFNFDDLYTTGVIRVVSTGGITFAQWAATELGNAGAPPLGDHNANGYTNLIEYALGLFPAVPATVQPNTVLHNYPDGQRLRVLFTRPLDRTDITIRVQASADLTNWSDLAVSVNSAPFTGTGFVSENRAHPLSEPGLVEVRDVVTTSSAARRYVRFTVTLAP